MNTLYRDITTVKTNLTSKLSPLFLLLLAMLMLPACSSDDEGAGNGEPGEATVRLVFLPNMMRTITESNENDIRDLSVFIFDNTGTCIGYKYNGSPTPEASGGYVVNIKTHEASNCTLYAIANIAETEADFNTMFSDKTTKSAIDNNLTMTIAAAADLGNGNYLPMFGRTVSTININRSATAQDIGKIEMEHVCSKIKMNIVPATGITITGYQLHHVPLSTYISDDKGYTKYKAGTAWASPSGTYADFTAVTGLTATSPVSNTFYMFENMVGEGSGSNTDPKERYAAKAPTNASYLTVTAQTQAWKSTFNVYLGTVDVTKSIAANGELTYTSTTGLYNNYDLYRNGEYTVTVNINGSGASENNYRVSYKATTIIYTINLEAWGNVETTNIKF